MPLPSKQDLGNSLDLVDIVDVKENTVIVKDGGLRQIIMVGGVNFSLKSDTEQNIIAQGYQTFLNGIDFPLQILVHSRKVNIDKYIEGLMQRKELEESPILQNQIDEYGKFIQGFVEKNAIMEKVFLVVVSFYPTTLMPTSKKITSMIPFLAQKKETAETKTQNAAELSKLFTENLAQLTQRTTQVTSGLINMGLEATVLTDEQLIELFYNFYNPQTIERKNMQLPQDKK